MTKTRTGRRLLSLLLTLCMALSLLPAVGITASAANGLVDGKLTIDSTTAVTDKVATEGWKWDGSTLTLSGVDLTNLTISVPATIVLEGANKIEPTGTVAINATNCTSLTIEGSGTLEISGNAAGNVTGIFTNSNLIINSGYISIVSSGGKVVESAISAKVMEVNGGYVNCEASDSCIKMTSIDSTYTQTGGYVKLASSSSYGLDAENVNIQGGYLEVKSDCPTDEYYTYSGIKARTSFTNSDGVVKATGVGYGIDTGYYTLCGNGTVTFSGGVTIAMASGSDTSNKAISGTISGLSVDGEKQYNNTSGSPVIVETGVATSSDLKSVVIAKAISYSGSGTLDGHYLKSGVSGADLTVSGGSYIDCYMGDVLSTTGSLTVDGTLVCVRTGMGYDAAIKSGSALTIAPTGTVVGSCENGSGVYAGSITVNGTSSAAGDLIGASTAGVGISSTGSTLVNSGYVYGVRTSTSSGKGVNVAALTVKDGYVTAVCGNTGLAASGSVKLTRTGAITAIGATTAYSGSVATGVDVTGAAAKYSHLTAVSGTDYSTYKVLTIKKAPVFNDGFGTASLNAGSYVVNTGYTFNSRTYTFAGWYASKTYAGTPLTEGDPGTSGTTYYAKWTKGGKTVVTTPLDFTGETPTLPADYGISWDDTSDPKVLTLDGATIDCSGVTDCGYAINLPSAAVIQLADDTESTVTGGKSTDGTNNYGISVNSNGTLSILGNGSLEVTSSEASNCSAGISAQVTVGNGSGSPNVIATGGMASYSYGMGDTLTVTSGSVTATGVTKAVAGLLTTTGKVMAGDTAPGTQDSTDYSVSKAISAIYVNVFFGPVITVAKATDGDDTAVYGAEAETKTYTATFTRFTDATDRGGVWCNANGTVTGTPAAAGIDLAIINGNSVTFTTSATANAGSYYFKVGAKENGAGDMVYSEPVLFTIEKAPQSTPSLAIDFTNEKLTGYDNDTMEYSIDGGENYVSTLDLSENDSLETLIPASDESNLSLKVRLKETTNHAAGEAQTISIPARPATPAELTVTPYQQSVDITEHPTGCEYLITISAEAPTDWSEVVYRNDSGEFSLTCYPILSDTRLTSGTQYYLHYRVKATDTAPSSAIQTKMFYTLPAKPAAVAPGNITVTSNSITITAAGNTTDNQYLVTPASYALTGGEVWSDGADTDLLLGIDLTPATPYKVWVRVKADGDVPASEAASTTICTAVAANKILVTADSITITAAGNTTDKQYLVTLASYALTGSEGWTDGTGEDLVVGSSLKAATPYKVWVRVKADGDVPASAAFASTPFYTAYATPIAEDYSINAETNVLEYDDTAYEVNKAEHFDGDSVATGAPLTSGTTYYIRHKAGTSPVIPRSAALAFTCAKAELSDFEEEINGVKGEAITAVTGVTITLTGDTFKDVAANTTFSTNVAGLIATVTGLEKVDGKDAAVVTISGTPTEAINDGLTITIPADKLQSGTADITSVVNENAWVKIATDTVYPREDPLDFNATEPDTISYTDKYGNEKTAIPTTTDITDSGEGWAWYAAESTPYDANKAITAANHPAKTLILGGVNIETNSALALNLPADATIVLKAGTTNTVKSTYNGNDGYTAGVTCVGALTIEGSGRLDATGGTATGEHDSMGVHGSNGLTINGGVVNGTGGASAKNSAGISADEGALTINGGTVKGQGGTSSYDETPENPGGSVGLYADGNIAVNGGSVTGNGGDAETAESIGISCGATVEIKGGSATGTGTTAAFVARSGIEFPTTFAINTPSNGVLVTRGDATTIFANATAEAPATNATIAVKPSSGGGGAAPATTVPVIVDGEEYNIGTAETSGGVTTVTVDQAELQKQLDSASENVVIPVTPGRNADTVTAQLVVANVDEMAEKEMTLSVQVDNVSYDMPAVAIDTKTLMAELGATDPAKVPVNVTIKELDEDDVDLTEGDLVMPPVSFTVTAGFGGKKVDVEVFERYVQRVIEVPDGGVASKITTAVVVENGKQHHVPTEVFQKDGKWYARINSLTNSVYALINNEKSFTDSDGKWYEAVVTEMASRGVIDGRDENTFDGEASITRAEFAAILVRALGLPENGDASMFTDVADDAWYYGAVGKAYEYKLIEGRGDGIFDPAANITRQEAMQMIYNASGIAPIELLSGINPGMYADLDTVSDWAKDAAGFSLLNGIVKGNDGLIRPLDNITRAESATIILRLLQKAELVDVRAEA